MKKRPGLAHFKKIVEGEKQTISSLMLYVLFALGIFSCTRCKPYFMISLFC